MDKLKMKSLDKVSENIDRVALLFPNCVTERNVRCENGDVRCEACIDFDMLRQELSSVVVDGAEERYQFSWPDKKKSILLANAPINKTLRPCREESVNFDSTQNLYIEGDNLDVLKLLQETYMNKVKMIYIDPPYNTGNDFVYEDDFAMSADEYMAISNQTDDEGNRLFQNNESNGRFHTDWLNMIYPRLKLAKDLLTDDGVIFISIDDNEQANLKKVCDEVFGINNFVAVVPRIAKRTSDKGTHFRPTKDYILVYAKNMQLLSEFGILKECSESEYKMADEDGRKYKKSGASLFQPSLDSRPNQRYYIEAPDGSLIIPPGTVFPEEKRDGSKVKPLSNIDKVWRWSVDSYLKQKHLLIFTKGSSQNPLLDEYGNQSQWNIYPKVYFDEDIESSLHPEDVIYNYTNSQATKELIALGIPFDFAKPSALVSYLIKLLKDKNFFVLDFFSGSATTAHAVMQLNAEDGGNRKFIMVQLPEVTDEKSEAYKAGYKNICEIGKERIRRAGKKITEQFSNAQGTKHNAQKSLLDDIDQPSTILHPTSSIDTGFRVLKLDSSNMKDVYYRAEQYSQNLLEKYESNIKEERLPQDLLFQVMLDMGVLLSSKIEERKFTIQDGKCVMLDNIQPSTISHPTSSITYTVFIVGEYAENIQPNLIACFDDNLSNEVVTSIAKMKPLYAVFRDSSFSTDSVATNFEQIFTTYSPTTERKVI